ncbi:hypothetical protein [Phaeobacter sp. B1627]|uniref:hypothetical protein n=1 Tax=Phaeobacter sp. B1627 TaxID=2583809 RepID=UPI001119F76B|nr:hypothetical protein [Phaeobacter sp. B1627]TNJ44386.1 hypothetical protein FGE21_07525 [Phaeobacter sp. B1627]
MRGPNPMHHPEVDECRVPPTSFGCGFGVSQWTPNAGEDPISQVAHHRDGGARGFTVSGGPLR